VGRGEEEPGGGRGCGLEGEARSQSPVHPRSAGGGHRADRFQEHPGTDRLGRAGGLGPDDHLAQAAPRAPDRSGVDELPRQRVRPLMTTPPTSAGTPSTSASPVARRPYVTASEVKKSFRRGAAVTHALALMDLTLHEGEFVAVVGPSGCGKSTLLRIIPGLLTSSAGTLRVNGAAVTAPPTALRAASQSPVLLGGRTV